jgi:hypothetical protein
MELNFHSKEMYNKEQCILASANGSMVETQEAIGYNKIEATAAAWR